jgi:hypothetical protein
MTRRKTMKKMMKIMRTEPLDDLVHLEGKKRLFPLYPLSISRILPFNPIHHPR